MRQGIKVLCLAATMVALLATGLWADDQQMTVTNRTGKQGMYLFVSPGDSSSWGPDLLDSQSYLENGDSHSFVISYDPGTKFDMMLVDTDGVTSDLVHPEI